jgi:hypothetical protein
MSLDKEVESLISEYGTRDNSGTKCVTGHSEHRELIEALFKRGVVAERICVILREKKTVSIVGSSIRRHMAGQCKCLI